jgi:hypothetical protein
MNQFEEYMKKYERFNEEVNSYLSKRKSFSIVSESTNKDSINF